MQTIEVIYTKRNFNPISLMIRYMIPTSRVSMARSSHGMAVDGDHVIEAHMLYGVRRVPAAVALKGATVVRRAAYPVDDAERGLAWFRSQVCTYQPEVPAWLPKWAQAVVWFVKMIRHNNYDFKGALGLGFAPHRNWQDPSLWTCYEGLARTLLEAGLDVFSDAGFITETTLFSIRHRTLA